MRVAPRPHFALPRRLPLITLALMVALWCVFALESARRGEAGSIRVLFAFGGTTSLTLVDHEYWRLVASCFVHGGLVHIAGNTVVLLVLGSACEPLYGRLRFLALYLAAGIGGAVATVLAYGPTAVGVGASGALYGLLAAFLASLWRDRRALGGARARDARWLVLLALLTSALAALDPHTSLAAHVGGFVTGGALALVFLVAAPQARPTMAPAAPARGIAAWREDLGDTLGAGIIIGAVVMMLTAFGPRHELPGDQANALAQLSLDRLRQGDYRGAVADDTRALRIDPHTTSAYDFRGLALLYLGDTRAALADFDRALDLDPHDPYSYYRRGLARLRLGDLRGAIADDSQALRLSARLADAYFDRGIARANLGDRRGAIADVARAAALYTRQHDALGDARARRALTLLGGA